MLGLKIDVTLNDATAKAQLASLLSKNKLTIDINSEEIATISKQLETMASFKFENMVTAETLAHLKEATTSLKSQAQYVKYMVDNYNKIPSAQTTSRRQAKAEDNSYKIALASEKELIRLEKELTSLSGQARTAAEAELQKMKEQVKASRDLIKNEETLKRLDAECNQLRMTSVKFINEKIKKTSTKNKGEKETVNLLKIQREAYQDIKRINSQIATLQQANVGTKKTAESSQLRRVYITELKQEKAALIDLLRQYDLIDKRKEKEIKMTESFNNTKLKVKELQYAEKLEKVNAKVQLQKQKELRTVQQLLKNAEAEMRVRETSLYNGRNKDYVSDALRASYEEKKATLSSITSQKELQQALKETRYAFRLMAADANATRQSAPRAVDSLATSFKNLTRYVTGAMIIRQVFASFRQGIEDVKQLDLAITTLKMTMQELSEVQIVGLMKSSQKMARELKADIGTVLNSVSTVANAQESIDSILNKTRPAVVLSNLTGLSSSDTVNMIQGAIYQFDALADGSAKSAMRVADSMVSISKSLGMDFATGIQGMSESVTILGSVANQVGMTMEETLSQIAAVAETTRASFSETATAMKAIISRVMRVPDGETTSDEMLKAQKALESVGVTVRDRVTGDMRDFDDIMQDLANRFDTLKGKEQDYIADALGGAQRVSTAIALVKAQGRAQEFLTEALNGTGSAMEAQETWAESLDAKVQDLQSSISILWQTFTSSDAVSDFLVTTTHVIESLTRMIEVFGSLPTLITLTGNSLMIFNKNFRALALIGVQHVIPSMGRFVQGLNTERLALEEQKIAYEQNIAAQKAKIISTQRLIDAGKTHTKEGKNLKKVLNGHTTQLKQNEQGLAANARALQTNTAKMIAFNLVASMGTMLAFTALTLVIGKVVESFKSFEERMEASKEAAETLQSTLDAIDQAEIEAKEYEELNKKLEDINTTLEDREVILKRIKEIEDESGTALDGYSGILKDENLSLETKLALMEAIRQQELYDQAKKLDQSMLSTKKANEELKYLNYYLDQYQQFKDAIQKAKADGTTDFIYFEDGSYMKIDQAQKELQELGNSIRSNYLNIVTYNHQVGLLEKANYTTKKSTVELTDSQVEAAESIVYANKVTEDNTDALEDNEKKTESLAEKKERLAREAKDNANLFVQEAKTLADLNELLEDVKTNGMTLDNIDHEALEGFTGNITDAAEVQAYLTEKIAESEETQRWAYENMMAHDEAFYAQKIKNSEAFATYKQTAETMITMLEADLRKRGLQNEADALNEKYRMAKKDLENAKTVAEARALVEQGLLQAMQTGWSEYYKMDEGYLKGWLSWYDQNKGKFNNPYLEKQYADQAESLRAYLGFKASLDKLSGDPIKIDLPTISKPSTGSSSSSSSSSSSEVDDLDLEIDRYHDLERAITRVNNALEANELAQQSASPTKKLQLMKEEINLYKQLQEAQKALYNEQKKEASELKKQLSKNGFTFNADGSLKNYKSRLEGLKCSPAIWEHIEKLNSL